MDPDTALDRALEMHRAGRLGDAIAAYEAIIAAAPDHAGAWLNLGTARRQRGAVGAAIDALRRADSLAPGHPGILFNLGNALAADSQLTAAAETLREAIGAEPGFADAYNNLGDVLMRGGDHAGAVEVLKQGLATAPSHSGLLTNLANAEHRLGDTTEALRRLRNAADLEPDNTDILRNLGNVLRTAGRLDDAEATLLQALAVDPTDARARCLLAFCRFAAGNVSEAWDDYAWRWHAADHEPARPFTAPSWQGEDLAGRSLLVWGEQAVGDEMMFATMFADLADRRAAVTVETEFRLQPLLARSFPDFDVVERRMPPAPALTARSFDFQIASGDLGAYLRRSNADFAASTSYLKSDPARTDAYRRSYAERAGGKLRVGLAWRSGAEQAGIARSLPVAALSPLLEREDCWFVNLQYGDTAADLTEMTNLTGVQPFTDTSVDPLADLDAAAAQMAALDVVVSAANTTVHMAGALGLPTWVLLSAVPDWRWMMTGERSLWYPSLHLVRPTPAGEWADQVRHVADQIMLRSRNADR